MKQIALLIVVEVSDTEDAMFKPREIGNRILRDHWSSTAMPHVGDWTRTNPRLVTAWRSGDPIPDPVQDAITATGGHE